MTQRQRLLAKQISASRQLQQVDNSAFVAHESAVDAGHALALQLDIAKTAMHCNHQGVQVNGRAIDIFPRVTLRLISDNDNLIPLDRGLLRDKDGITSFRFGSDSYATEERYDALKLVKLADAIRPF